jgi:hypothetical protein
MDLIPVRKRSAVFGSCMTVFCASGFLSFGSACAAVVPELFSSGAIEFSLTYDGAPGLTPGLSNGVASFGAFEVEDFSFDIEQTLNIGSQSSGAGAGKVTFDPFQISKLSAQVVPGFFVSAVTHKATGSVVPVFGFTTLDSAPAVAPTVAPILSPWQPGDPCFQLGICQFSGVLVAYDAPVQVGTFDVTFVPVPEPATWTLIVLSVLTAASAARRHRVPETDSSRH